MTALVVDGTNLLLRAVYATENRVRLSSHGVDTTALVVFVNMLSRLVRAERPDRLVICWDGGRSERRLALYPQYKASRKVLGEDFTSYRDTSASLLQEFLTLAAIPYITGPGIEADDLIAAFWHGHREDGEEVLIASADKDFLQLLDEGTTLLRPSAGNNVPERWNGNRVREEYGCEPADLPTVFALAGDQVDDIPGIPGYGVKTAVKRLKEADWNWEAIEDPRVRLRASQVTRNLALVDLRETESSYVAPLFRPTDYGTPFWDMLLSFLDTYELAKIKKNLLFRTLWKDPEPPR